MVYRLFGHTLQVCERYDSPPRWRSRAIFSFDYANFFLFGRRLFVTGHLVERIYMRLAARARTRHSG